MKPTLLRNVSFVLVALLLPAQLVMAQSPDPEITELTDEGNQLLEEYLTSRSQCLDGYQFGSVEFDITNGASSAIQAGQTVLVSGTVENTNDYPLPEGQVYVHVSRQDAVVAAENWHPLVHEGSVPGDFSLAAHEKKSFSFSWQTPSQAPSGIYRAEFFYLTGGRFVMSGLPYTPAVSGGSALFSVTQPSPTGYFEFDRGSVQLQGQPLQLRAVPPVLAATTPVNASVNLKGVGGTSTQATVKTSLYRWSITDGAGPIAENTTTVTVPANGAVAIPFSWDAPEAGAYELVYELVPQPQLANAVAGAAQLPTRLKFRFPVAGNVPRIMFSGITGSDTDNFEITTCSVNSTFGEGQGTLGISVADTGGREIGTTQAGTDAISLSSSVVLIPKAEAASGVSIAVEAKDGTGKVVDSHTMTYAATELAPFIPVSPADPVAADTGFDVSTGTVVAIAVVVLLILIGLVAYAWQKRKDRGTGMPPINNNLNPPSV